MSRIRFVSHDKLSHRPVVAVLKQEFAQASARLPSTMALPPPPGFAMEHGFTDGAPYEPQVGDLAATLPTPILPAAADGPGASSPAPRTIGLAFAAYGLSPLLGGSLLALLQCGEEDSAEDLAAVPDTDLDTALPDLAVGDEGRPPTLFEKGAVRSFFKKLRTAFATPTPFAPPSFSNTPPAPIKVQIEDKSDRKELRDYIDQACHGSFKLLSPTELAALRDRYFKVTGAAPTGEARPTNEQLSAMCHSLRPQPDGTLRAPFTEFAIFGPYNARSVKLRHFHAHVLTREGTWQNQLLKGPASFATWLSCWKVFETCMIMLGAALPGQLHLYRDGIERLDKMFPRHWGNIAKLDETMRSERWDRLLQEITDGTVATPHGFNPERPWGTIISETRFGYLHGPLADWWREQEVQMERSTGTSRQAPVLSAENLMPNLPSFSSPAERQAEPPRWGSAAESGQTQTKAQKKREKDKAKKQQWAQNSRPQAPRFQAPPAQPKVQQPHLTPKAGKAKGKGKNLTCFYCGVPGHTFNQCTKWHNDGKPDIKKQKGNQGTK